METWQKIRHLATAGRSDRRIARKIGVAGNSVAAAHAADEPRRRRAAQPWGHALDPILKPVEEGLRRGLSGRRLLEEVHAP